MDIGTRLSAKSYWGRVCVTSPSAREGEDGEKLGEKRSLSLN
jgi:hypothetical protein